MISPDLGACGAAVEELLHLVVSTGLLRRLHWDLTWWRLLNSWDGRAGGLTIGWHVLSSTTCQSASQLLGPKHLPCANFFGSYRSLAISDLLPREKTHVHKVLHES